MTTLTAVRECPRCGKIASFLIEEGARSHVECPTCKFSFEISALTPKIKKGAVGAPSSASHEFKYIRAGGGAVEFAARLRRYAKRCAT